jgi:hypothetical protein
VSPRTGIKTMTHPPPRPWWPKNHGDAKTLALKLRSEGAGAQLFEMLALTMAMHDWGTFSAAMEVLCEINARAIKTMLENQKFDIGWSLLYNGTGMPRDMLPLFLEILKTARTFETEDAKAAGNRAVRLAIIQQALASPSLRRLPISPEFKAALLE